MREHWIAACAGLTRTRPALDQAQSGPRDPVLSCGWTSMEAMMGKDEWSLVANASQARLFREQADGRFVALGSFQHPKGRERSNTLVEGQRKEHLRFAAELADVLEGAAREGSYASLR